MEGHRADEHLRAEIDDAIEGSGEEPEQLDGKAVVLGREGDEKHEHEQQRRGRRAREQFAVGERARAPAVERDVPAQSSAISMQPACNQRAPAIESNVPAGRMGEGGGGVCASHGDQG